MADRNDLKHWVLDAVRSKDGSASIIEVAQFIWDHHKDDLKNSGDLFYKWQYDMRWAANVLRHEGKLKAPADCIRGRWDLS